MPKIIMKCGYMKQGSKDRSGFVEYIAKRDGVIKLLDSSKDKPATTKQKELIQKLVKVFPASKKSELYQIYEENQTLGSASGLITHLEEDHYSELLEVEQYVSYIAQRPRVVKEGSHGLFSDEDNVNLEKVKSTIKDHQGNIWTTIVSLKREDAHRLDFDNVSSWKALLQAKRNELAKELRIDPKNFHWYGAFHDEAHHPHVHIVMYSDDIKEGYLTDKSINNIRKTLGKEIFHDELVHIYQRQTELRDELKLVSKEKVQNRIQEINQGIASNQKVDSLLMELSKKLETTQGKKLYGYLPKNIKSIVDEIIDELSNDPSVQKLFDAWYEQKREIHSMYSNQEVEIRHLSDLQEFKSIKNAIIHLAETIQIKDEMQTETKATKEIERQPVTVKQKITEDVKTARIIKTEEASTEVSIDMSGSVRLLYHLSRIFESSMQKQCKNYDVDSKLLLEIKKKKIALGMNQNDQQRR